MSTSDAMTWREVDSHRDVVLGLDLIDRQIAANPEGKQELIEGALRVVKVRRQLLDQERHIRKASGLRRRAEATIVDLQARLSDPTKPALTDAQRMDIEGRIEIATADAEYYIEITEQLRLEQEVWRRMLPGG